MQNEKYSLCLLLRFDQMLILLRKKKIIIRLLHEKNKNQIKLLMPFLCFWTRAMKSLHTRNQGSVKIKPEINRQQGIGQRAGFLRNMKCSSFRLLCQNRPLGLQHPLVIICQTELPSSQSALPTRSVHAVMFETDRVLSLIHLNYCYNFSTLC